MVQIQTAKRQNVRPASLKCSVTIRGTNQKKSAGFARKLGHLDW